MLSGVRFANYGYDSSQPCSHAPGRRDGVRRLRLVVIAGGRIYEKVGEADLPPRAGAACAKSSSALSNLTELDGNEEIEANAFGYSVWARSSGTTRAGGALVVLKLRGAF